MRYAFIEQEHLNYAVGLLCRVMQVSRSGFYAWRRRPKSEQAKRDEVLTERIRVVHIRSRGNYGAARVHAELRDQRVGCGKKRIARLMRLAGLRGKCKGESKQKRSRTGLLETNNLLGSKLGAAKPNEVWMSDITYLRTQEGWLYLAVVLDAFSRRVVGWAMQTRLTTSLSLAALDMAHRRRKPPPGLIHHSDSKNVGTGCSRVVLTFTAIDPRMLDRCRGSSRSVLTPTLIDIR